MNKNKIMGPINQTKAHRKKVQVTRNKRSHPSSMISSKTIIKAKRVATVVDDSKLFVKHNHYIFNQFQFNFTISSNIFGIKLFYI